MDPKQQISEWLNEIVVSQNDTIKVENLIKVQEYLLHKDPQLTSSFGELLSFCSDPNKDVRKLVAGFIEQAGDKYPDKIPELLTPLILLLSDTVPAVLKRSTRTSIRILKSALKWIARSSVTPEMETAWNKLSTVKTQIMKMIDSDNEGIRTQAIKFLETLVLLQTHPGPEIPKNPGDFSLEDVPLTLKILRHRKLEEEANQVMDSLIKYYNSSHITSVNLITCMGTIVRIAKMRPQFINRVIQELKRLQGSLPPTLSSWQILSVKKQLEKSLQELRNHPARVRIKQEPVDDLNYAAKRQLETPASSSTKRTKFETSPAIELSDSFIVQRLTVDVAIKLVIEGMNRVPDEMTGDKFLQKYPDFSVPRDLLSQRGVIARLLQAQLRQTDPKKNYDPPRKIKLPKNGSGKINDSQKKSKLPKADDDFVMRDSNQEPMDPSIKIKRENDYQLDINIPPLSKVAKQKLLMMGIDRIISSENSLPYGVLSDRSKILLISATLNSEIKKLLLLYISEDLGTRLDLAVGLLYEEYALDQGFKRRVSINSRPKEAPLQAYNTLLCTLVALVNSHKDCDSLSARLYLEVPLITEEMVDSLKIICDKRANSSLYLLKDLISLRPTKKLQFLNILLFHTGHQQSTISEPAIRIVVELCDREDLSKLISEYAVLYLGFLQLEAPPEVLFGRDRGREVETQWSESTVRVCLGLYQALLQINKGLIHQLARIYTSMKPNVKRFVIKLIESSIRSFGIDSPEVLSLVENCPRGSETLVTRIVHILTEKEVPGLELVSCVRKIYETRSLDVRFLIPVLNGLTKQEVIAILPKLIKLNSLVVREIINRLSFAANRDMDQSRNSPLTPADLMIALHNLKPSEVDLKTLVAGTGLCFAEKEIFTQEILAIVINRLADQTPLPILLMRTVMQALIVHPQLSEFVLNILQRLVLKKIWTNSKLFEGFAKCCCRLQPQSFAVIRQLPQCQIDNLFEIVPELKNNYFCYLKPKIELLDDHENDNYDNTDNDDNNNNKNNNTANLLEII
ncbi:symplekin-like [Microplitis mediator]|uniref:symplekin-like n=1 Tax=Microplitis mediator TaxID=375433 RepID=UPI002556022B|nr:symplekin-like [Microplitis mediator]